MKLRTEQENKNKERIIFSNSLRTSASNREKNLSLEKINCLRTSIRTSEAEKDWKMRSSLVKINDVSGARVDFITFTAIKIIEWIPKGNNINIELEHKDI